MKKKTIYGGEFLSEKWDKIEWFKKNKNSILATKRRIWEIPSDKIFKKNKLNADKKERDKKYLFNLQVIFVCFKGHTK